MEGRVDLGTAVSVQPVPKAAYRSDFGENTNFCPQRDSNLGPLTHQASVLPLDHCDLYNNSIWKRVTREVEWVQFGLDKWTDFEAIYKDGDAYSDNGVQENFQLYQIITA